VSAANKAVNAAAAQSSFTETGQVHNATKTSIDGILKTGVEPSADD